MTNEISVAVLFNFPSEEGKKSEFSASETDTEDSAHIIVSAINRIAGMHAFPVGIDERTIGRTISGIRADLIFNLIEWTGKEIVYDRMAFTALDTLGIPYTGAPEHIYIGSTDKLQMKKLFDRYAVPSPKWTCFSSKHETVRLSYGQTFPVIVKLAYEHCGVGLSPKAIIRNSEDLPGAVKERIDTYKQPVIAEEYIEGEEYQVTVMDMGIEPVVLPIAEYVFDRQRPASILTYDSRWKRKKQTDVKFRVRRAKLPAKLRHAVFRICLEAYKNLGYRGYARFDIRIRGEEIFILEGNANPGLDDDPDNGLVRSFRAAGMDLPEFCGHVLSAAACRFGKTDLSERILALMTASSMRANR